MADINTKTATKSTLDTGGTIGPTPTAPGDSMVKNPDARVPNTVSGTTMPATNPLAQTTTPGAQLQTAFQQRQNDSATRIGGLYDKQLEGQKLALQNAYQQNLSDQEAARANITGNYQTAANDLAVQYERNRRNLNQQALANGLNTGVASQQRLALNQGWMRNYGTLKGQEASALTEADRQITNLKNNYQNSIAQAIADNDYKRAAALLDDYNNQNNWFDKQAQLLAGYGDFSAYASMYGPEAANNMKQIWIVQNPDAAYATGQIDKAQYKKITGKNPGKKANGGSYWGGYGNGNGNSNIVDQLIGAGATPTQVNDSLNNAVTNGTMTPEQARQLIDYNQSTNTNAPTFDEWNDK